jgi:acyl carrier protein
MSQPSGDGVTFDEFCQLLAEELRVPPERITPDASFINDLAVDSIRMVELILRIEELGVSIPSDAAWNIVTVQDAYDYYQLNRSPARKLGASGQVDSDQSTNLT